MFKQIRFAPILIASMVAPAMAGTVCVTNVTDLQAALTAAQGATSTTNIEVARGTYNLGGHLLQFSGTGASQGQLDIEGGFSADCSTQIKNPALTILDAQQMSGVLQLGSSAGLSVRYLTMQNGLGAAGAGLSIGVSGDGSTSAGVIVDYNILRNNSGTEQTAFSIEAEEITGNIRIEGNLIEGNAATEIDSAGGYVANSGTGNLYVTNNTIANNHVTSSRLDFIGGMAIDNGHLPGTFLIASNNIGWGNSNFDIHATNVILSANDFGAIDGTPDPSSSGNLSIDPEFSSATDFHLLPVSPILGQGTLTPAGNLPTIDIEGHPRSYNGLVDMGAYERGDEIYDYGFDD